MNCIPESLSAYIRNRIWHDREFGPYFRFMWKHKMRLCAVGPKSRYKRWARTVPIFAYQMRPSESAFFGKRLTGG